MPDGKTLGIISIKGGVGKTSVVANLGASLAHDCNKKILLVDANTITPHLGLFLGLVKHDESLQDVLSGDISPFKAIYQHSPNFSIIPGSLSSKSGKSYDILALKEKLEPLKSYFDLILIDSAPTLSNEMLGTMLASDEILVVTSPDYPTLSSTLHATAIAKKKNTPIKGIIINKARNKKFELTKSDIEAATKIQVLSILPDDARVLEALSNTMPATLYAPRSPASREYRRLASQLAGTDYVEPSFLSFLSSQVMSVFPFKKQKNNVEGGE